jgi:hypothetical protein
MVGSVYCVSGSNLMADGEVETDVRKWLRQQSKTSKAPVSRDW